MIRWRSLIAFTCIITACRGNDHQVADSAGTLPPVFPAAPGENTNWNADAGPFMIAAIDGSSDSVAVVLPYATDSTIGSLQGVGSPIAGLTFDLFSRSGKAASSVVGTPLQHTDTTQECYSWPAAKLRSTPENWQIGFVSNRVQAIPLESIESMSSTDSASLAASLAQAAATLPVAADPGFRGLPFRVRSAYTFRLDSVDIVVADIVRSVNEEAKPRVEHLFIVGERPAGPAGKVTVSYFNRAAGAEETTAATEILAAVQMGAAKRPVIIVNVESDDGGKFGFVERSDSGKWQSTWRSAYTDC
jgi:hypothetical protein